MKKRAALYLMIVFYVLAGINHFRNPEAYYLIIPPYLGDPSVLNIISGIAEIALAVLLLFPLTRRFACYGIIAMLIAFIPAHIYMLKTGWCIREIYCLPQWAIWVRLVVMQPLLIWWAWKVRAVR